MLYFILLYIIVTYSWKSNEEAYTFHALAAFKPSTHYPLDFIKAIAPLIVKPNFGPTLINPAWENPAHYHGTKDYLAYNSAAGEEKAVMCYSFGLVNTCNIIDSFTIPVVNLEKESIFFLLPLKWSALAVSWLKFLALPRTISFLFQLFSLHCLLKVESRTKNLVSIFT